MTHFHSDHASGLERFAHATIAADRVEWHAAEHGGGYHRPVVRAVKRREILDYDDASAGHLDGFALPTLDLFGDGSVTLISTRGHSAGHQSLLVRCASGRRVLLLGDAAHLMEQIDDPRPAGLPARRRRVRADAADHARLAGREPGRTVVPGHDPELWPTLEAVYE